MFTKKDMSYNKVKSVWYVGIRIVNIEFSIVGFPNSGYQSSVMGF